MARPHKNAPLNHFTSFELAISAGLSPRNFGFLADRRLAPEPTYGTPGKANARAYNTEALKRAAITGAIYGGGIDLLPAARLGALAADDLANAYYTVPSKLDVYLDRPLNPRSGEYPWENYPDDERMRADLRDDFWLHYLLRSRTSIYRPGIALACDVMVDIADRQYIYARNTASVRRNAVALVRINISLAVRNALDRLYEHRLASRA